MKTVLNQEEIREMLKLLAAEFKIKVPTLRWSNRIKRAHVMGGTIIYMGPERSSTFPIEAVVLHEFAHVLSHVRCRQNTGRWLPNRAAHGPAYRGALLQVVESWTGNKPNLYPWNGEYKLIQKWFSNRRIS